MTVESFLCFFLVFGFRWFTHWLQQMVTIYSTNYKQARYWCCFNKQIKFTSETKFAIGFRLCHVTSFSN